MNDNGVGVKGKTERNRIFTEFGFRKSGESKGYGNSRFMKTIC